MAGRSWTYGRAPRNRHFAGFFNVPAQAPTQNQPFYGYSEKRKQFYCQNYAFPIYWESIIMRQLPHKPHRLSWLSQQYNHKPPWGSGGLR